MSIASEITALNTNLQNAKDAVTAKGGTVGNTGLAGLATEIASIPAGGGQAIPEQPTGVYAYVEADFTPKLSCTKVEIVDASTAVVSFSNPDNFEGMLDLVYPMSGDDFVIDAVGFASPNTGDYYTLTFAYNSQGYFEFYYLDENGNKHDFSTQIYEGDFEMYGITISDTSYFSSDTDIAYLKYEFASLEAVSMSYFIESSTDFDTIMSFTSVGYNQAPEEGVHFLGVTRLTDDILYFPEVVSKMNMGDLAGPLTVPDNWMNQNHFLTGIYNATFVSIGDGFLYGCDKFNSSIDLSNVTSIGEHFLTACLSFNQPITFPNAITSVPNAFLNACSAFNSVITFHSGITSIGDGFLRSCNEYTKPINWPSGLLTIGDDFLALCTSFNQDIVIPEGVTTIKGGILNCSGASYAIDPAFASRVVIPSTVTSLNLAYSFYNCSNFTGDIIVNTMAQVSSPTTSALSVSMNRASSPMYTTGVTIKGPGREIWLTALPNQTSGSARRKLIDGGE